MYLSSLVTADVRERCNNSESIIPPAVPETTGCGYVSRRNTDISSEKKVKKIYECDIAIKESMEPEESALKTASSVPEGRFLRYPDCLEYDATVRKPLTVALRLYCKQPAPSWWR